MNNPYFYRPQPSSLRAADDIFRHISSHPEWRSLFGQGKMLGVLVYSREPLKYICAYSGVINGLNDSEFFFVPPIYDLQNPEDFYLQKDAEISAINSRISSLTLKHAALAEQSTIDKRTLKELEQQILQCKNQRKQLSLALQIEIFHHFNFYNVQKNYKNIIDIFQEAKRGLPPGGAGECAAPRLLQYAIAHQLEPLEIAEFWYGQSPRITFRVHGQFYPSCIEKCSPILKYMALGTLYEGVPDAESPQAIESLQVLFEDEYLLMVNKPAGVLSVPGKVAGDSVEEYLHRQYPDIKGPMLVHRLDQATSGILLAAKNATVHKSLQQSFETRDVHKEYLALLNGVVKSREGVINLPICPNPDDRPRQTEDFQFGKKAITYYQVKKYNSINNPSGQIDQEKDTLIRFVPFTGRTHQLRLHAASHFGLGHSIVGDRIYGGSPYSRLMLHAYSISFIHPVTNVQISIQADCRSFMMD